MNKKNLLFLVLLGASGFSQLEARQWFQPSPLSYGYAYSHYPFLPPVDENECNKCYWLDMVNPWMAAEFRHANRAFLNKDGTRTNSLAGLLFDQESFTLANLVAPGASTAAFPLASLVNITPNFDYTEHVAWFGLNVEKRFGCEEQWHVGLRLRIPFRDVKTELDSCCDLESGLGDLYRTQPEVVCTDDGTAGFIPSAFAYRLDFLTKLGLVNYAEAPNQNVFIANVDVTNQGGQTPPVNVKRVAVGSIPSTPFSLRKGDTGGATPACAPGFDSTTVDGNAAGAEQKLVGDGFFLSANGTSGFAADNRAVFNSAFNYSTGGLAANSATQATLWVLPTIDGDGAAATLTDGAIEIQNAFTALLAGSNLSALNFLSTTSAINFNTQRTSGPGDFLTEMYVHRDFCGCWGEWFAEGIFGATFPTGKRNRFPNLTLLQPLGNNRHFEVKIGGFLGWKPFDWMAIKFDGFYNWALRRNERVAASFVGATVRNIGPAIDAKVSWQYFVGDVDITFMVPCVCPELGVNVGYQPYVKRSDKVSFGDVTTAANIFGTTATLDATVLETRTKQVAHTIKGEIFYQACAWQLFGGFNHAVAGKNAPKQSAWYLGADVYF